MLLETLSKSKSRSYLIRQLSVNGFDAAHNLLGQQINLFLAWTIFGYFLKNLSGVLKYQSLTFKGY